jgi:hypothetical protein
VVRAERRAVRVAMKAITAPAPRASRVDIGLRR